MAENLSCKNHPNVSAIEECANCAIPMCGMCSNFTETDVLCEKCVEIRETEKYVAAQSQQLDQPEKPLIVEREEDAGIESPGQPKEKKSYRPQLQWTIIVACLGFLIYRLYFYSPIDFVPLDDETRARELAITSLSECLLVFTQIGQILARGNMPAESLRCDQSGTPNIVTESGDDIKISHPHPDFYGYLEIFVTRNNPEPTIVE